MGCGTSFVKYVLFFFNLLVAILGLAMIGIGVAFLMNWTVIKQELESHLTVAPWVFIVVGAITFIIAFFGCCGAVRESHCMVVTYAIFLLVIIIVQVALAILLFTYGDTIKQGLVKSYDKIFDDMSHNKASYEVVMNLQKQFSCCGKKSAIDYVGITLPESCCSSKRSIVGTVLGSACTLDNADEGCSTKLGELYEKWNNPIAGVAIGIACIEVVGALFALCLANSIRNMDRRSHY